MNKKDEAKHRARYTLEFKLEASDRPRGIGGDRAPLAQRHLRDDLVNLGLRRLHHAPEGVTSLLARQRQQTWGLTPPSSRCIVSSTAAGLGPRYPGAAAELGQRRPGALAANEDSS